MNDTIIIEKKGVKLNKPILIEGLPGVGLVAKIAVDYLIKKSKAEKIAKIYSSYFPPQVNMTKKGVVKMPSMKIYKLKGKNNDFLILAGDIQPNDPEGQYKVNEEIIKYFKKKNGRFIITLGGYGTGNIKNDSSIYGAATSKKVVEKYSRFGIKFGETAGAIVGAAGLLIGIGKLHKIDGLCLMALTQGNYIDPKAAFNLLLKLLEIIEIKIDTQEMENKVAEGEKFIRKLEEMAQKELGRLEASSSKQKDLTYIR
ncbi:MAG: proteasome assembly chaperone family protein [Candidatus Anstonellaceae archaeon]